MSQALTVKRGKWVGGLAEWRQGETVYLSIVFTWLLGEARARAVFHTACGYRVVAGGPALFLPRMRRELEGVAEIATTYPEAVIHHNPDATIASRGCPVGCSFCIVPVIGGRGIHAAARFRAAADPLRQQPVGTAV